MAQTLDLNVADGVHRVEDAYTNWYLVEDGDRRLTIVDAGVPTSWGAPAARPPTSPRSC
jgi:hypothetical protein